MAEQFIPLESLKVKPLAERARLDKEGVPFPVADDFVVPEGAKGIHTIFCSDQKECGFYSVSPYTIEQWKELNRIDKYLCPLCRSEMNDELIKMPMRVTDKVPAVSMTGEVKSLLGKNRHERWDFTGGAGYYHRQIELEGKSDKEAWEKMQRWAKGGTAAGVVASQRAAESMGMEEGDTVKVSEGPDGES